jgi:hypothetical protein
MASDGAARLDTERLCSFIAVQRTQHGDEVLSQLVLQMFVTGPVDRMQTPAGIRAVLQDQFGLDMAEGRLQSALDRLLHGRQLARNAAGHLDASPATRQSVLRRFQDAGDLQARVKESWLQQCSKKWPGFDKDVAWKTLDSYLTEVFKQHGMYSMALLDPAFDVPPEYQESMGMLLQKSLVQCCAPEIRKVVEEATVTFLAEARSDADRASYISQLADAAFSYFAISAPPDVAARLREQLKPLTLFIDTNALFAVVGLDESVHCATTTELLAVLGKHSLPYKPRFHERTGRELRGALDSVVAGLKSRHWPPSVSRAAAASGLVSTIERLYHERNAASPLTAATFFEPYAHIDVLLEAKGVRIYRDPSSHDDGRIFDMIADYKAFLEKYKREKPYESLDHDMRLLDCVRRLRSKAPSSLDAEALLVTYDFLLFRFDWVRSKKRKQYLSVVLPDQLLQLLRPFIVASTDFDRSFAAAFSFPLFRSLDTRSSAAAKKMLEIVATYKDIPEQTVASLLGNKLLLDKLRQARSDRELEQYVESAIAAENATLVRKEAALRARLEAEQAQRDRARADVAATKLRLDETQRRAEELARGLAEERESRKLARDREAAAIAAKDEAERNAQSAEDRAAELAGRLSKVESQRTVGVGIAKASGLAVLVGVLLEMLLPHSFLTWLAGHPNSYGLRGAGYLLILALCLSLFVPRWRRWTFLGTGVLGILLVLLQLLGGASQKQTPATANPTSAPPEAHK